MSQYSDGWNSWTNHYLQITFIFCILLDCNTAQPENECMVETNRDPKHWCMCDTCIIDITHTSVNVVIGSDGGYWSNQYLAITWINEASIHTDKTSKNNI